jgi:hypothetical protein
MEVAMNATTAGNAALVAAPEEPLELVGLDYIQRLVGDRTPLATRRWTERLRAKGALRPVYLAESRKLRFRKADVLALLSIPPAPPTPAGGRGTPATPASA